MTTGTINLKLRPLKLAFLVDPKDKPALLESIEINTFLWGGMFNPIIPTFNRAPRIWQDKPFRSPSAKTILKGYLDAFDPDFVVPVGQCAKYPLTFGDRTVISSSEILAGVEEFGAPNYGVGFFEILNHLIDKEFKFLRRKPLEVCFFDFKRPYDLFLKSAMGSLPSSITKLLYDNFQKILEPKRISCSVNNFAEFLTPNKLFLRRISSLYIEPINLRPWRPGPCVFLLDAINLLDIIDFWNLRALGWNVLPVPKQAAGSKSLKELVFDFVEENFFPDRFNPNSYHNTTFLKSRSISEVELHDFAKSLKIPLHQSGEQKFMSHDSYPRIWDEGARRHDNAECCDLEVRNRQYDFPNIQERISIRTLDPEFITNVGIAKAQFANEIGLHIYGSEDTLAEVFPQGSINPRRAIDSMGIEEWRFSKKGIVFLSRHPKSSITFSVPKAEDVFLEWLRSKKWEVKISSSGHIAKQVIKRLGGRWGIWILAKEGIIGLLKEMREGRSLDREAFWGRIQKIANEENLKDADGILKKLIDVQMFRLGIELQCPICRQHSWYSIKDADYEMQCLRCLDRFLLPSHSPKEITWSYRTFGPFSLPEQAYGVYSVLLTLHFFSQILQGAITPILSFNAEKTGKKIEADLGLFYQKSMLGSSRTELIFAECKTYNSFEKKDAERMLFLANEFPGAILVFATLKRFLTEGEKRLLRPVANRGRGYWKAARPFNPVLILTGTELFSNHYLSEDWKKVGGKHATFADRWQMDDILYLCDATQQIYLDMKPLHQWLEERWEKRRRREVLSSIPQTIWVEST